VLLEMDAGELDDEDEELWTLADLLNIACGGHAGDERSMQRVLEACKVFGIKAGAHPSYPDRAGFGRTTIAIDDRALETSIFEQCHTLRRVAEGQGVSIDYAKPHGALYHDANRDRRLADVVVSGVMAALGAVTMIAPPRGALRDAAVGSGMPFLGEDFADRGRRPDGSLIPRGSAGALIDDPEIAASQARASVADALCVHADTPNALAIARAVRAAIR
jgi:5-oxoprolinase (ATP-hydrolysing) subunit A